MYSPPYRGHEPEEGAVDRGDGAPESLRDPDPDRAAAQQTAVQHRLDRQGRPARPHHTTPETAGGGRSLTRPDPITQLRKQLEEVGD